MHDIKYIHHHELEDSDFSSCCLDCRQSMEIIKPHLLKFTEKIKLYEPETLVALGPEELYRIFQVIDDLVHLDAGDRLAGMVLADPDIRRVLPTIRSYYITFFRIHETHLAEKILQADDPWQVLESFPLYPRYKTLIRNQVETMHRSVKDPLAFVGCGPVPLSLILLNRMYGLRSIGLDKSARAVSLARKVIRRLGLEEKIEIVHGTDADLRELEWDIVLVAALAEPKSRIFRNLREIMQVKGPAPVVFRTYTGMRAILYRPVQPEEIAGFRIIRELHPTGRVNNTLVLLELT